MTEQAKVIAEAFVAARQEGRGISAFPGARPADLCSSYAIQDVAIGIDGRTVLGWKVGRINPPDDTKLGANRLAGPIFAGSIVEAGAGETPEMPVIADGFAAAEAEFLLHVAPGWNGAIPAVNEDVRELLDAVHVGIEIASSPYPGINADGPTVTASDFGNNFGLVIGPEIPGGKDLDFDTIGVSLEIDGKTVGEATTSTMLDGPLGAVRFLLGNLKERGIDCGAGLWVSTGAVTGVHEVVPGNAVRADFAGVGSVECRIGAARSI